MPLLEFWRASPATVAELSIEQVVSMAGDGTLRDGSACSSEVREYLAQVSSAVLATYVEKCLTGNFERKGLILQDFLINELGRRLDFKVTNGRYQGVVNAIGFDGIWMAPEGQTIIVEVKTTDAYRISLDTIAGYRTRLLDDQAVSDPSSILIVVGRQDTGDLEAQVRGSRHAWDVRMISAEALINLVAIKEETDELETSRKIRSVLIPVEFTRLDGLVDLMFTAAQDTELAGAAAETSPSEAEAEVAGAGGSGWEFTDARLLQAKRDIILASMVAKLGSPLIKNSRAKYWSGDHNHRIVCTISKRFSRGTLGRYWYAYHPQWDEFLAGGETGHLILGGMDLEKAFAIPRAAIFGLLEKLNTTKTARGIYWHLHVAERTDGAYELEVHHETNFSLTPFELLLV